MDYPLLILDGDNAYDGSRILDGFDAKLDAWEDYAIIYYFQPTNDDSHWAFAMLRRDRVWDIQEKNPHAPFCGGKPMVGVFFFSNVRLFLEAADTVLKRGIKTANEFFMSQAVKQLLDDDIPVLGQEVTDVIPLGTPQDVEQYLLSVSGNVPKKKLRICLDLDDTINYCKKPEEEYGNEEPQERAVEVIRKWKSQGHYIIIQTARHMNTCNGNVGQVVARQGLTTLEWLNKYNVPFDELWFGKPHADVFIDDKAIRHEKGNWAATEMAINSFIQTRSVS
jgi:capsule biosynthesis phosphatase